MLRQLAAALRLSVGNSNQIARRSNSTVDQKHKCRSASQRRTGCKVCNLTVFVLRKKIFRRCTQQETRQWTCGTWGHKNRNFSLAIAWCAIATACTEPSRQGYYYGIYLYMCLLYIYVCVSFLFFFFERTKMSKIAFLFELDC